MERTITIDTPVAEARPDSKEAPEAQEDSKPMDGEELHDCRNPDSQNQEAESRIRDRDEMDESAQPARSRRRINSETSRRRQRQEAEEEDECPERRRMRINLCNLDQHENPSLCFSDNSLEPSARALSSSHQYAMNVNDAHHNSACPVQF